MDFKFNFQENPGSSSIRENLLKLRSQSGKGYLHKNHNHVQLNFTCLYKMYCDKLLCDFVLVAGEREVHAHKLILASCSTYFYFKFSNDRNLGLLNRIEFDNITFETLTTVLNYIYNSEILINQDNVEDLMAAAYMFVLKDLHEACIYYLRTNLCVDNCIKSGNIARRYRCIELCPIIDDYIGVHFTEVMKHHEYLELTREQIKNLVSSDALSTAEENVLKCVIAWVRHDLPNRKQHIFTLMNYVRIPLISQKDLIFTLDKEEWLKSDPSYNAFLGEMFKCYFLEGHTFSKTPRLSPSKILVAVGITSEHRLSLEIQFNIQKNTWLSYPEALKDCKGDVRTFIHGLNLYCVEGNSMKYCNISNPTQIIWTQCKSMLYNSRTPNITVLNNSIYALGYVKNDQLASNVGTSPTLVFSSARPGTSNDIHSPFSLTRKSMPSPCGGSQDLIQQTPMESAVESYNISKEQWSKLSKMPDTKFNMGVGASHGRLYAVGGRSNSGTICNTAHYYEPHSNSWADMPSMSINRIYPGVASLEDRLYIVGGYQDQGYCKQVECFDRTVGVWSRLPDMNIARQAPGVIAVDNQLYVIGGYNNVNGFLDSVEVYDPNSNSWSILPGNMKKGMQHVTVALVDRTKIKY